MVRTEIGQRLANARERSGKTEWQLAKELGISVASYFDLETSNDLLISLDIPRVALLCCEVNISAWELFDGTSKECEKTYDYHDIAGLTKAFVKGHGLTQLDLEEKIGWSISPFPSDPESAGEWVIECLKAVCSVIGIDWHCVLPRCRDAIPETKGP